MIYDLQSPKVNGFRIAAQEIHLTIQACPAAIALPTTSFLVCFSIILLLKSARFNTSQRAIVVLKHFHGLSYREIAYIMEIPEKTVKSRLYDSRQQLRKIFYKQGYVQ